MDNRINFRYRNKFINQFKIKNKKELKIKDYEMLIHLLQTEYEILIDKKKERLLLEKIKVQEYIEYSMRIDISPIMILSASIFISIITFVGKVIKDDDIVTLFSVADIAMYFATVMILMILLVVLWIDYKNKTNRAYNNICYKILEEIEKIIDKENY